MIIVCNKCGASKDESQFYKRPGGQSTYRQCKDCVKEKQRENYNADPQAQIQRVKAWQDANRASVLEYNRKRYTENQENIAFSIRQWQDRNPIKVAAHRAVYAATKSGALVHPGACEQCGSTERIHAHHDDYRKPLEVRWLCINCHRQWHSYHGEAKL